MPTNTILESAPAAAQSLELPSPRALLRQRIGAELESLAARLGHDEAGSSVGTGTRAGRVALASIQGRMRELGQLLAGLADPADLHLDTDSAGFGSIVRIRDAATAEQSSLMLMTGATIDVSGHQVSMESPIGAALIGARPGDVVEVDTPAGRRRLEIVGITTLLERFG